MEQNGKNSVDRILDSLEGIRKVQAPDFFYTRLIGRMQKDEMVEDRPFFILKPAFITSLLLIVLALNIYSLMDLSDPTTKKTAITPREPATLESFAKAYALDTETLYE